MEDIAKKFNGVNYFRKMLHLRCLTGSLIRHGHRVVFFNTDYENSLTRALITLAFVNKLLDVFQKWTLEINVLKMFMHYKFTKVLPESKLNH